MNRVLEILGGARRLVAAPDSGLRDAATATLLDGLMTTMLGHAAPEVERLTAAWRDTAPIHGATLLSIPSGMASPENAACANAVALCWFELDPGFRHAGCHVTLHTLPALLAAGEFRQSTIAQTLARFIFCYEVVARLAMNWDTRPSGLHSHAVFSNLGAVLAVCAAYDEDDVLMAHALDLASSALNCGQSWEVSEGGELRNLWPGLAAANAFTLYRAAKAGVTTTPGRLERSFDGLFRRREESELGSRFARPALLENYAKVLPACRHLHAAIEAALQLAVEAGDHAEGAIESVDVSVHAEAAALAAPGSRNLINAQFSLPICIAIALSSGRFDPNALSTLRQDASVLRLAERVRVRNIHHEAYPADRSASIALTHTDGRRRFARIDVAEGDPVGDPDAGALVARKAAVLAKAYPPDRRDMFVRAQSSLLEAFKDGNTTLSDALLVLGR
jgi:2-methylcitrate dehydratase PrpD